jgi:two-component system C4-dicarboxylate transport sensor histidine kinase DctB
MESQNVEAISQAARFEIVGKIAADMIYDATGSLGVIKNASEELKLLSKQMTSQGLNFMKDPMLHQARRISMMSHRVQSIVDVIDGLARDGAQENNDHVNLNDLLAEVSDIVEHFAKNIGVSVEVERPQQVLTVPMQRLRIGQVLTNLLINACEAVKGGADCLVKLAIICDEEWIYIAVTNAGRPIPAETRIRLFEPHFSTKKSGLRTGVGLFVSRQIAREHGGDLYFDDTSELTRFVLELPLLKPTTANQDDDSWEEI